MSDEQKQRRYEEMKPRDKRRSPKDRQNTKDIKVHFIVQDLFSKDFESLDVRARFIKEILRDFQRVVEKTGKTIDIDNVYTEFEY